MYALTIGLRDKSFFLLPFDDRNDCLRAAQEYSSFMLSEGGPLFEKALRKFGETQLLQRRPGNFDIMGGLSEACFVLVLAERPEGVFRLDRPTQSSSKYLICRSYSGRSSVRLFDRSVRADCYGSVHAANTSTVHL